MVKGIIDGHLLVLGLSDGNIERLRQGKPIAFEMKSITTAPCPFKTLAIVWGETEERIVDQLTRDAADFAQNIQVQKDS